MSYREAFGAALNSRIRNGGLLGLLCTIAIPLATMFGIRQIWPELTKTMVVLITIPAAITIALLLLLGQCAIIAMWNKDQKKPL